jgi:hypothetical protein
VENSGRVVHVGGGLGMDEGETWWWW